MSLLRKAVAPVVIALAAFLAVLPLMLHGYSCGHDFDFHLRSWMEASTQWHSGILKPVWAFHAAWNAGEPRLLFYPPLSWITGAALTTLLPWMSVSTAFTGLVLFLSGITMHRLLRRWVSPGLATLGGCLYLANPYMLFCAYERTASAELMAAAWMPLLLAALLRSRISVWRIALAIALLWITNAPAAVVGCYSVLLIGLGRLIVTWRNDRNAALPFAAKVTAGTVLGLLSDSFYLLPIAVERRYVQLNLAIVPNARPDANFLFASTGDVFHDGVLLHSSSIAVGLVAAAILCGIAAILLRRRAHVFTGMRDRQQHAARFADGSYAIPVLIAYSILVLALQTKPSMPVWHVAPELVFLQFPWRFLAMQAAVSITVVTLFLNSIPAWTTPRRRLPILAITGIVIAALAGSQLGNKPFRQGCDSEEGLEIQRTAFLRGDGFEQTDEYTPVGADNDAMAIHLPLAWLAPASNVGADPKTGLLPANSVLPMPDRPQPDDLRFHLIATPARRVLMVRLRSFHGWHILRDGVEVIALPHRNDGNLAIPLPADGPHTVQIRYRKTWDQWLGALITFLGLIALIALARREHHATPVSSKLPK